jgi:hypothetical protein
MSAGIAGYPEKGRRTSDEKARVAGSSLVIRPSSAYTAALYEKTRHLSSLHLFDLLTNIRGCDNICAIIFY